MLGQLILQDTSGSEASKTITIVGQGAGVTVIEPSTDKGFGERVFEIISQSGASLTVNFQNLTIAGGYAANGGILGGNTALGGGLLIDGGTVSMTNVDLVRQPRLKAPLEQPALRVKRANPVQRAKREAPRPVARSTWPVVRCT